VKAPSRMEQVPLGEHNVLFTDMVGFLIGVVRGSSSEGHAVQSGCARQCAIFEQEICEDIMKGGPCRGVLVDVRRFLIREVGLSKGDAKAERTCLRGDTAVKVLGCQEHSSPLGGVLGWHAGRGGDSTNDVGAEDGKSPYGGGRRRGAHRDSTALWLTC
jgi:hypothetical protein